MKLLVANVLRWLAQLICAHDWKQSPFVNIQTGKNLGSRCKICGKYGEQA